eukprot:364073-Chlamydomonas_euryale.AAC.2
MSLSWYQPASTQSFVASAVLNVGAAACWRRRSMSSASTSPATLRGDRTWMPSTWTCMQAGQYAGMSSRRSHACERALVDRQAACVVHVGVGVGACGFGIAARVVPHVWQCACWHCRLCGACGGWALPLVWCRMCGSAACMALPHVWCLKDA